MKICGFKAGIPANQMPLGVTAQSLAQLNLEEIVIANKPITRQPKSDCFSRLRKRAFRLLLRNDNLGD
jgi:hypothetical protein